MARKRQEIDPTDMREAVIVFGVAQEKRVALIEWLSNQPGVLTASADVENDDNPGCDGAVNVQASEARRLAQELRNRKGVAVRVFVWIPKSHGGE